MLAFSKEYKSLWVSINDVTIGHSGVGHKSTHSMNKVVTYFIDIPSKIIWAKVSYFKDLSDIVGEGNDHKESFVFGKRMAWGITRREIHV